MSDAHIDVDLDDCLRWVVLGALAVRHARRCVAGGSADASSDPSLRRGAPQASAQRAKNIANKARPKIRVSTKLVLAMKGCGCNVHRAKLGEALAILESHEAAPKKPKTGPAKDPKSSDGGSDGGSKSGGGTHDHKANGSSFSVEETLDTPSKSVPGERNIHTTTGDLAVGELENAFNACG